jgi:hypothetical protein
VNGQWIGQYTGSDNGRIILNVDERPNTFEGIVYLHSTNSALPSVVGSFQTPGKGRNFQFRVTGILPINPDTGLADVWDNVKTRYPDAQLSSFVDVEGSWNDSHLRLKWTNDVLMKGECDLPRSQADEPSELAVKQMHWAEFKRHVEGLVTKRYLFRGQDQQKRLRTAFHRSGRANMVRLVNEDIPALRRHLSARTKHVFNLLAPDETGAFYTLVQHHGYPTPLLDWSYSPYVAAFFAYRSIPNRKAALAPPDARVRIHIFDQAQWRADWPQPLQLLSAWLYVSVGEFLAIENERLIPQQAASTVTNVDDIEAYIRSMERGKTYLTAIDLPVKDRREVMGELAYMGITAGSLFPGLDGACEELRERNFDL